MTMSLPINWVTNIFCPTGTGGGIDPTCGAGKSGTKALGAGVGKGELLPDYSMTGHRKYQYRIAGDKAADVTVIDKGNGVVRTEKLQTERPHRGKGVAKQMYLDLFQELKAMGVKQVISGQNQSPGGAAVWESLMRDGVPIKKGVNEEGKESYTLDLSKLETSKGAVTNIFCPTGTGGGINPTCGGGSRSGGGSPAQIPAGTYGMAAPKGKTRRQLPPASPEGARQRFEDVAKSVFGKKGRVAEDGAIVYSMPGGRFISVKLQATVVARHGSHVILRYDARVDFGVEGRSATSVSPRLERESVAALRKVKEAAQAYRQAGFSLEVQPSDSRRKEAYGKILTGMGLKLQQSGEVEVWNELDYDDAEDLLETVTNIFCPTGPGGGIIPDLQSGTMSADKVGE